MTQLNDDQEQQQEEAAEAALPTSGELLRAAREQAGLTVLQVADRLRLRQQLIQDLENDHFDGQAGGTYVRGYLRAYAKLLQISESEIMDAYKRTQGSEEVTQSTMQSFSKKTSIESQDNKLMILTWIIVIILIGSVAVFVWQQFLEDKNGANQSSAAETQQPTAAVVSNTDAEAYNNAADEWSVEPQSSELGHEEPESLTTTDELAAGAATELPTRGELTAAANQAAEDLAESAQGIVTDAAEQVSTPAVTSSQNATNSATSAPATEELNLATALASHPLVFVFHGDSWVRIEDADGEPLAFGVKVKDYIMPLAGKEPYSITLGAPHLVDIYYLGEKVDLSAFGGGRVARLQVPEE
ncbi:MAG: DUF4115 domain-containing protein [Aliidiomarina sp.]|uniref:RodZ domain-containing protein n=1 Tax=Aliidiomarina sp. TaxID=1872439 RepID=UPI0025C0C413|nr:RodZ domain-containing protein [Aliidiomarina sp.]MCH8502295.1 DUF4115 domain-containing protein [Aliidiomarina sp.]